jgi:imidazolonepropionase-like amidohydrolase
MNRISARIYFAALTFGAFAQLAQLLAQPANAQPIALTHASVLDVTNGSVRKEQTLIVSGDRIQAIGSSSSAKIPQDAKVLDATGKYVIPGLWDSHVHTRYQGIPFLSLFILNGVTSVRDTAGPWTQFEQIKEWRHEVAAGRLLSPRILSAGPLLDGPNSRWSHGVIVTSPGEGRKAVDEDKARGVDFVKVYDLLGRDTYYAVADESKRVGLNFFGHVPFSVSAGEASDAGQSTIEHLTGFLEAASTKEDELQRERLQGKNPSNAVLLDTYSEAKADALIAKFAKNHTVQDPTLSLPWTGVLASEKDPRIVAAERLQFIPAAYREQWAQSASGFGGNAATRQRVFAKYKEIVGKMQKAGVVIIAGTDTLKPYLVPGYSLQDELEQLAAAGLSPLQVLQAATINPAKEFRVADLGTVEPGKIADLLLLDGNPLDNISNTRRIFGVVANGRLVDKSALETLARETKTSVAAWKGTPTGR